MTGTEASKPRMREGVGGEKGVSKCRQLLGGVVEKWGDREAGGQLGGMGHFILNWGDPGLI